MLEPLEIPYQGKLKIGTCSWKYDSWKGIIYQNRKYGAYDYLADYALHFNTVEIDQWFWSLFPQGVKLPDPNVVHRYSDSVPDAFRFSVKAPNAITLTHYYAKQPKASQSHANQPNPNFLDRELLCKFLETLEPMKDKLGPIMFQFEYLNKQKMAGLPAFLERLGTFFAQAPKEYQYAIEIRNPNYLKQAHFDFLREQRLGCVLLDGYYMPPIGEVTRNFEVNTAGFLVLRLHGVDRSGIEKKTKGLWDQIIEPQDARLAAAANISHNALQSGVDVCVNVNNHYEGCGPLTIQRFLAHCKNQRP
jgi:uncharacterized protein YecE (DUF72 family)